MSDELFMADSSPYRQEVIPSPTLSYPQLQSLFYATNRKSKILAYHMMRSLIKRILNKFSSNLKQALLKSLLTWRYSPVIPRPYTTNEQKLTAMFFILSLSLQTTLKKSFSKWLCFYKLKLIIGKRTYSKSRREEAHMSQLGQMNKALNQILIKQSEVEKAISQILSREKQYKDTIDDLARVPVQEQLDLTRQELLLKELEAENQALRDKLEAIESNVNGFIREMGGLLENEDDVSVPSDDDGVGDSQGRSTRKKRSNFIR